MKQYLGITVFFAVGACLLTLKLAQKSPASALEGWKSGTATFLAILPVLFFAMAVSGLTRVLVPKEAIGQWLGASSGWRGIWLGCIAGAATPGGPYTSFPIVVTLQQAGAGLGTLVAYVTAWSLWALFRLPLEISLIGLRFAIFRLLSTLVFPPLAGYIAHILFSKHFK